MCCYGYSYNDLKSLKEKEQAKQFPLELPKYLAKKGLNEGGESKDRAWATTGTVIPTTGAPGTHRHHRGSANGQTWKKQHFSSDDIFSTVLGKIDKLNEHYIAFTQYLSMSW